MSRLTTLSSQWDEWKVRLQTWITAINEEAEKLTRLDGQQQQQQSNKQIA